MNLLEIAIRIGYDLAKKEKPDLDDEKDHEFIKRYCKLVKDCFLYLDKRGYMIALKEPSWDSMLEDSSNKSIAYISRIVDEIIEKGGRGK